MEPKNKNLVVHQVDETSDSITKSLGILPDRENEIEKIVDIAFARTGSVTDTFVEISEQVKHPTNSHWLFSGLEPKWVRWQQQPRQSNCCNWYWN